MLHVCRPRNYRDIIIIIIITAKQQRRTHRGVVVHAMTKQHRVRAVVTQDPLRRGHVTSEEGPPWNSEGGSRRTYDSGTDDSANGVGAVVTQELLRPCHVTSEEHRRTVVEGRRTRVGYGMV